MSLFNCALVKYNIQQFILKVFYQKVVRKVVIYAELSQVQTIARAREQGYW